MHNATQTLDQAAPEKIQAPISRSDLLRKAVLMTGDRPTGALHLGHYVGSLRARVALQCETEPYILLADLQAMTDNAGRYQKVTDNVLEVALDYLAAGIDPNLSTIFIQSQVPELMELTQYLMNLVSVARLERNPTIKEEIRLRGFERDIPAGFLAYPVSQAADILAFRADLVPVGSDQLPMIEQTNELARKFNASVGQDVLQECKALLSPITRLPGIDGSAKMSKSMGNSIALRASDDEIARAVRQMYTDSKHLRVSDPGQVEGNVVFMFLDAFDTNKVELEELKANYQRGGLGDSLLKRRLTDLLQSLIAPMRAKREHYASDKAAVMETLRGGTDRARERAAQTLGRVRRAMGLVYFS